MCFEIYVISCSWSNSLRADEYVHYLRPLYLIVYLITPKLDGYVVRAKFCKTPTHSPDYAQLKITLFVCKYTGMRVRSKNKTL
jgi:hypothetical protein